jgi:hypothetical protein
VSVRNKFVSLRSTRGDGAGRNSSTKKSVWRYANALAVFGRYGDGKRSRKALGVAFEENVLAAAALLDLELPPNEEDSGVDDALACAEHLLAAWDVTPGAFDWLEERFDAYMSSPRR